MAKTDYKSIDEYHKAFDDETLKRMKAIRELVYKIAPEAQEVISYQIPAFKIGDKFHLIYYCTFQQHLTLSSPWSDALIKEFKKNLKGMKVSKSAIQMPHDQPLPLQLIKSSILFRKKEYEATRQNSINQKAVLTKNKNAAFLLNLTS
jgi:uncharacterized protein YdhG (YjbR/CyaY superfamily)